MAALHALFAQKNYDIGMYYFRDKMFDSGVTYFRDVLEYWPNAPRAKDASLRLIDIYKLLGYKEEVNEICASLRAKYATDPEVAKACPMPAVAAAKPPTAGDTITAR